MDTATMSNRVVEHSRTRNGPQKRHETANGEQTASRPLGTNVASLARDLARMADLQLQLLTLDVRQFWSNAHRGLVISVLAGIAILGALPVLLLGIAGTLKQLANINTETSHLLVGSAFVAGGTIVLWFAVGRIGNAAVHFRRSQEELTENLKWVRETLHKHEE